MLSVTIFQLRHFRASNQYTGEIVKEKVILPPQGFLDRTISVLVIMILIARFRQRIFSILFFLRGHWHPYTLLLAVLFVIGCNFRRGHNETKKYHGWNSLHL